jgi:hypothetical protein
MVSSAPAPRCAGSIVPQIFQTPPMMIRRSKLDEQTKNPWYQMRLPASLFAILQSKHFSLCRLKVHIVALLIALPPLLRW